MFSPVVVFETACKDEGFYERKRGEANRLVGLGDEAGYSDYREKCREIKNKYSKLCYKVEGAKYCVYQYKDLKSKMYVRYPVLSAMRGMVVKWFENGDGVTMAFPFAKFFNRGEVDRTRNVPEKGFVVTEKLDGTLIVVWIDPDTGEVHYNTRGLLEWFMPVKKGRDIYIEKGDGVVNPYVRAFVNSVKRLGLLRDLEGLIREGRTLMFELVGREPASRVAEGFRIIDVDDESWRPYFLGVRENDFRLKYAGVEIDQEGFSVPQMLEVGSLSELIDSVGKWRDKEGVVLYYPGKYYDDEFKWWNYLVKVKSYRYLIEGMIYRDGRVVWRGVLKTVLWGGYDDLVSIASGDVVEFAGRVREIYDRMREFWFELLEKSREWSEKDWNRFRNQMKMGWMEEYIHRGWEQGEESLRMWLIKNSPRDKEGIIRFMERVENRIQEALKNG